MNINNFAITVLLLILILSSAFLGSLVLTGREIRTYDALDPDSQIKFKGKETIVRDIVERYQPVLYQLEKLRGPTPSKIFYEVISKNDTLTIVYRYVWPTETHPNQIIAPLYNLFRVVYYGSSKDIEYLQIDVDSSSGEIMRILYETDTREKPNVFLPKHAHTELIKTRESDVYFKKIDGKIVRNFSIQLEKETYLKILTITWNHVFDIYQGEKANRINNLVIEPLDSETYKEYKLSRRSSGDYTTDKDVLMPTFFFIVIFSIELLIFIILRIILRG